MNDTAQQEKSPETIELERREAWLAERRQHITSSDLPAIMGLPDAYGTPMKVFLEKKNLLEKGSTPDWLEAGLRLQPVILNWYADRRRVAIRHEDPYALTVCESHPIIAASLDARWWDLAIARPRRCVDAKNVRFKRPDEWGEEGSSEIPGRYVTQLHCQMVCTGETDFADLAALFGGSDPAWYEVPFDPEIAAGIIDAGERFWMNHVQRDIPPPVDGSDEWTRWLNSRQQKFADYRSDVPPEIEEAVRRGRVAALDKKQAEEQEALYKNIVRAFIGEHAGLILPSGQKVHYKRNRSGEEEQTDALLAELASRANVDLASFRKAYITSKPGARPLLLGKDKE
jgi:putative phage-type endonuclease